MKIKTRKAMDAWEMIPADFFWGLIGNFSGGKLAMKLQVGIHYPPVNKHSNGKSPS